MVETQREVSAYALPLPSAVYRKFPTFPQATALQHCFKSSCHSAGRGGRGATALPVRAATSAVPPVACDRGWALPNL